MKLTFQELNLLCALAEQLGWVKCSPNWGHAHDTLPPTYYMIDDWTHGVDVRFRFLRSRPSPGMSYSKGDVHPIWWVVFDPWNPLESLDDAWMLVEAIAPQTEPPAEGTLSLAAEFGIAFPPAAWRRPRNEVARMICLAAAKAWGIQTELTS